MDLPVVHTDVGVVGRHGLWWRELGELGSEVVDHATAGTDDLGKVLPSGGVVLNMVSPIAHSMNFSFWPIRSLFSSLMPLMDLRRARSRPYRLTMAVKVSPFLTT